MSHQIPQDDYELIGFSKRKDTNYWKQQDRFNHLFDVTLKLSTLVICIVFNIQLFTFDVDLTNFSNLLILILNIAHASLYSYINFQSICTLNIILLAILRFFDKKYEYLNEKLQRFLLSKQSRFDNQKLNKLIYDFDFVTLELIKVNEYMSKFIGINFFFYLSIGVLSVFMMISGDLQLQIALFFIIITTFTLIIYLPNKMNNYILDQMSTTGHLLSIASFNPKIDLINQKRINNTCFYLRDRKTAFTCFQLFTLTSYYGQLVIFIYFCIFKNVT